MVESLDSIRDKWNLKGVGRKRTRDDEYKAQARARIKEWED
jgi:hypothetical protein